MISRTAYGSSICSPGRIKSGSPDQSGFDRLPWSEEQAAATLIRAQATLLTEYRGDGMPFGHIVAVDESAPSVDRLAGFLGRTPAT